MPVLMIGAAERAEIKRIVEEARAHPVPSRVVNQGIDDNRKVLEFKDRKPGIALIRQITIPVGYCVAFSIEEQPCGMCSHLSISVQGRRRPGMMPDVHATRMICEEFGVPFPPRTFWVEEFEPGEYAANLVSLEGVGGVP